MAVVLFFQAFPDKALAAPYADLADRIVFNRQDDFAQKLAETGPLYPGALITVHATAYSSTPEQTDSHPFTTASGTHVRPGIVAANFVPLGSIVRINGHLYTVEDRMAPNSGRSIDIWMNSTDAAFSFGHRVLPIEIVSLP